LYEFGCIIILSSIIVALNERYIKSSSSSSSSAYYSPLLVIGLSNVSTSRSIFGYSHPALASRPAQTANRHSTRPEGVLHYVYLDAVSTPELIYPNGYRFYG
jgi:hypothetical protein